MALNIPLPQAPDVAFGQGLDRGLGMYQALQNARLMREKLGLAQQQEQRAQEMMPLQKQLMEAQTQLAQTKAQMGGFVPSGDVSNALYVEMLRNQFGEQDPRYLQAKKAHEMTLEGKKSLIDYRDILGQTAPFRATSPLGKSIAEGQGRGALDVMMQGGQQRQVSPEIAQAYEQDIAKRTTDTDARKRKLFAENIDKTLSTINTDDLIRYSGLEGTAKYLRDHSQAVGGTPPADYIRHQQALESASLLAHQIRQFYGDSIQPAAQERLRSLTNPTTWYKNPKVALAQFNQLKKILEMETETYKKAGTSPIKLKPTETLEIKNNKFVSRENDLSEQAQELGVKLEDIEHTAQLRGITPQDVIRLLKQKRG